MPLWHLMHNKNEYVQRSHYDILARLLLQKRGRVERQVKHWGKP